MTKKANEAAATTKAAHKVKRQTRKALQARWDATKPSTKATRSGDGTAPESPA